MKTIKLNNKEHEILEEIYFKPIVTFKETKDVSNNYYTDRIYVVKDIPITMLFNINPKHITMNADFQSYYINVDVGYSILYNAQNGQEITTGFSKHLFSNRILTNSLQNKLLEIMITVDKNRADGLKDRFKK